MSASECVLLEYNVLGERDECLNCFHLVQASFLSSTGRNGSTTELNGSRISWYVDLVDRYFDQFAMNRRSVLRGDLPSGFSCLSCSRPVGVTHRLLRAVD